MEGKKNAFSHSGLFTLKVVVGITSSFRLEKLLQVWVHIEGSFSTHKHYYEPTIYSISPHSQSVDLVIHTYPTVFHGISDPLAPTDA